MPNDPPTILTVARWPVGGIRTYLRDLFSSAALCDLRFVLVAPNVERLDQYVAEERRGATKCVASRSSVKQMTCALVEQSRRDASQLAVLWM